jgi:hypothetical protein
MFTPLLLGVGVLLVFVLAVTIWTQLSDPKSKKTYGLYLINVIAGLFLFYAYTIGMSFLPFVGYPRY